MIDVVITVRYDEKAGTIGYDLDVSKPELGLTPESDLRQDLSASSMSILDALFRTIEQISPKAVTGAKRKADTTHADARIEDVRLLEGIGEELFHELVPEKLRDRLRKLVDVGRLPVATLQIRSNETFIPWELLRIPGRTPDASGVFLAEAFCLTRWLVGHEQVTKLPLSELALVTARQSKLPCAGHEHSFVSSLSDDDHKVQEVKARYAAVMDAFASGRHDGWHFTGHGVASSENSSLWSLQLDDYRELTSYDLRRAASGLGAKRPLVFANACHSGRGGAGLTRTGGLGRAFLNAGAGAYVGCHWALHDAPAYEFARAFYGGFLDDALPIGEAVRRARLEIRERFPGDPAWLAYTVFAHPLALCRPSSAETETLHSPDDPQQADHCRKTSRLRRRSCRLLRTPAPRLRHRWLAAGLVVLGVVLLFGFVTVRDFGLVGIWGPGNGDPLSPIPTAELSPSPETSGAPSEPNGLPDDPQVVNDATPPDEEPVDPDPTVKPPVSHQPSEEPSDRTHLPPSPRVSEREGVCVRITSGGVASSEARGLLLQELKDRNLSTRENPLSCRWRIDGKIEADSKEQVVHGAVMTRNSARIDVAVVDAESNDVVDRFFSMQFNNVQNADIGRLAAIQEAVKALFTANPEIRTTLQGGN